MSKPSQDPPVNQVWKLIRTASKIEIIPSYSEKDETINVSMEYVKMPEYIDVSQSSYNYTDSPEELFPEIINRAVELATATWQGTLQETTTVNQRNE